MRGGRLRWCQGLAGRGGDDLGNDVRRASTGRALVVDHTVQIAFDEEQMLPRKDAITRGRKRVVDQKHGGVRAGVVHAGVAFRG